MLNHILFSSSTLLQSFMKYMKNKLVSFHSGSCIVQIGWRTTKEEWWGKEQISEMGEVVIVVGGVERQQESAVVNTLLDSEWSGKQHTY